MATNDHVDGQKKNAGIGITVFGLLIALAFAGGGSYLLYSALTTNAAATVSTAGTGLLTLGLGTLTSPVILGLAITCIIVGIGMAAALILHPILRPRATKKNDGKINKDISTRNLLNELESARSQQKAREAQEERKRLLAEAKKAGTPSTIENQRNEAESSDLEEESTDEEEESSGDTPNSARKLV